MKINFTHNLEDVENELFELIRGFYPFVELSEDGYTLDMRASVLDDTLKIEFTSDRFGNFKKFYYFSLINTEQIVFKREYKRAIKIALYRTLSFLSDVNLPYGCLTGIRPTKLYREYGDKAAEVFSKEFSVSEEKIELIDTIVKVQEPYLNKKGTVDIFINIP
ncbi:MAG: hypothetical protein GX891_00520, partial [Clostridiales bacterium]|nr:hypothetical protein [Clostridiales bacterium]